MHISLAEVGEEVKGPRDLDRPGNSKIRQRCTSSALETKIIGIKGSEGILVGHVVTGEEDSVCVRVTPQVFERLTLGRRTHRKLEHILALANSQVIEFRSGLGSSDQPRNARVLLRRESRVQCESGWLRFKPDLIHRISNFCKHLVEALDSLALTGIQR